MRNSRAALQLDFNRLPQPTAAIEEQSQAQGNLLGGLQIVRRYHCASRALGHANLSKGLRPDQRTRFRNGRRFQSALLRCSVRSGSRSRTRAFARAPATEHQRSETCCQDRRDAQSCSSQPAFHTTLLCEERLAINVQVTLTYSGFSPTCGNRVSSWNSQGFRRPWGAAHPTIHGRLAANTYDIFRGDDSVWRRAHTHTESS
jgi:hypothetical protein